MKQILTAPEQAATRVQALVGEPRAFKPRSMARKRGLLLAQSQLYLEARLLGSHMFIRMENKLVARSVFWDLVTVSTACSLLFPQKHDLESPRV